MSYSKSVIRAIIFVALFSPLPSLHAQVVIDPRIAEFDPSPDHSTVDTNGIASVTTYDLHFFLAGSPQVIRIDHLGKPEPDPDGKIRVDFASLVAGWPTPGTIYEARVVAIGPGGETPSDPSNTFSFSLGSTTPCTYTISPLSASVPATQTTGTVSVTTESGCSWTSSTGAGWITANSTGVGSGTATYSIAANTSTAQRTGTFTIAGQNIQITQDGANCSYAVAPSTKSVSAGTMSGVLAVTAGSGCAWTATSGAEWIALTGNTTGSGNGSVAYSVSANTSSTSRTGTISVEGKTLKITQAGTSCSYSVSQTAVAAGPLGSTTTLGVTAGSGCSWTTSGAPSWITVTKGASGTANGTVTFVVAPNTTSAARTANLTIAGKTVKVTQEAQTALQIPTGVRIVKW